MCPQHPPSCPTAGLDLSLGNPDSHSQLPESQRRLCTDNAVSSITSCYLPLFLIKAFPDCGPWYFQDQLPQEEVAKQGQPSPGLLSIKGTNHLPPIGLFLMPAAIFNLLQIKPLRGRGVVHTPVSSETCEKIRWREVYSEVSVIISSLQPQGVTAVHTPIPELQTSCFSSATHQLLNTSVIICALFKYSAA